jgi:hypothetical protein
MSEVQASLKVSGNFLVIVLRMASTVFFRFDPVNLFVMFKEFGE